MSLKKMINELTPEQKKAYNNAAMDAAMGKGEEPVLTEDEQFHLDNTANLRAGYMKDLKEARNEGLSDFSGVRSYWESLQKGITGKTVSDDLEELSANKQVVPRVGIFADYSSDDLGTEYLALSKHASKNKSKMEIIQDELKARGV